jgi:PPK2 family polyphosphate:nucleotide phosphotransferase
MNRIKLSETSTRANAELNKKQIKDETKKIINQLDDLQNLLYAGSKHSILVILQGMDASGKDGAIRNVFGNLNPQGVSVKSFKAPTDEELSHDFLWRVHMNTPAKGMIKIFNRSHYEDILITRVHGWCDDETAVKRIKAINEFEDLLVNHNQTVILKFYLHISKEEQDERLNDRITNPKKHWKYNEKDFSEAKLWDQYMVMYQQCFEKCNAVPWHIIPSDQNWYKEYLIASHLIEALKSLNMQYPGMDE